MSVGVTRVLKELRMLLLGTGRISLLGVDPGEPLVVEAW
jgi:hypothetical protein